MFQAQQNLPPVLSLSASAKNPEEDVKDIDDLANNQIVIILHTRDITDTEERLCQKFGRIRHYNPSMINRDLESVPTDYLFVDVRNKTFRLNIGKVDASKFKFGAYVHKWEKPDNIFDEFCEDINVFSSFPSSKVTYKSEFDDLLSCKNKIKSPNSCLSFLACVVNIWETVRKK
jgi:hypothetical protein